MTLLTGINYLAVFVATIVYFIIGFLWYSKMFAAPWRNEHGLPETSTTKPGAVALIGQFISTLLYTAGVAIMLKLEGTYGIAGAGIVTAFMTVFFIAPVQTGNLFFTGKRTLFVLDVAERALGTFVVGVILVLWR